MSLKPWREIIIPHADVLGGTFQQSEFAADLTAVRVGKATPEYGDAKAFYERTFITEGMGTLLTQVALRLNGKGGEPVIQLQTAFGGGKTHTMLAVYHLASRKCPLRDLAGVALLLDQAKLLDVPEARVSILDGSALSPGQPWKQGRQTICTLWGELAWQLGKTEGYAMVKQADENGTSPGKDVLCALLTRFAPCVVLVDELVVYIRQFSGNQVLSGGTYDTNLSFIQSLTEAVKLVPSAVLLASLPDSNSQAGGAHGLAVLQALEAVYNRVQAIWKAVSPEEAFEIVRRRLFEPVRDAKARDQVCRAFADAYIAEGAALPPETIESRYYERMVQGYPIHPEVFKQLYEEWTTIQNFQRTRGVLKLMAKVIHRLWQNNDKDLMILPGGLPLYDGSVRSELTNYLSPGWDPVLDRDVDGENAETTLLEKKQPRFGTVQAARRVARSVFLGSAPASVATASGARGITRARILLGCMQPNQTISLYTDALQRLADQLHYLNTSDDRALDATRYWFDVRANLRRTMEERKSRFDEVTEVTARMAAVVKRLAAGGSLFEGTHVFTAHSDVPDDSALRLVVLAPEYFYSREEPRLAHGAVAEYLKQHGTNPRQRANRLLFLAPDYGSLARLKECIRAALAWASIVEDVANMRLVLDTLQAAQAKRELQVADAVLPRAARECFKWLLCPSQENPRGKATVESFPLNTGSELLGAEVERVCTDNELVIPVWSPVHLHARLKDLYWKADKPAVSASLFFEDTLRYLYLPRLKTRSVLEQAILKGAGSPDFFGSAYGSSGTDYVGFQFGASNVQFDDTLLLIEPAAAAVYARQHLPPVVVPPPPVVVGPVVVGPVPIVKPQANSFFGSASVPASAAKVRLMQIADEIIAVLVSDPTAEIVIRVEIEAKFPGGVQDQTKRSVSENARQLAFKNAEWE